jgi:hypothetical protein
MIPSSGSRGLYNPETLTMMTHAFDRACDFFPVQLSSDYMRRKLALHIIRQVDDGESDPTRLVKSALSLLWKSARHECGAHSLPTTRLAKEGA